MGGVSLGAADGGNKVRTLQHQLAVIESKQVRNIHVLGTGGSNQVVATVVHGLNRLPPMTPLWIDKDLPDLDNSLNMLSTLSLPVAGQETWGAPVPMVRRLLRAVFGEGVIVTAGGNCPAGVLGQVGGCLELADQIAAGIMPPPNRIYLPLGSSCTTSGLIMGIALARHLKLDAFQQDRPLCIVAVPVHKAFAMLRTHSGHSQHRRPGTKPSGPLALWPSGLPLIDL